MLKKAFLVALRNLKSKRTFTLINIFGLGIGICFSGLIYLFVKNEESFDQFHKNKSRIFRIESNIYVSQDEKGNDKFWNLPDLPDPLISALQAQAPEVQLSSRVRKSFGEAVVKYQDDAFPEKITYVEN